MLYADSIVCMTGYVSVLQCQHWLYCCRQACASITLTELNVCCQAYVGVWLWLQCRYSASPVPLSSSVCMRSTMHFLQSVHRVQRWWYSGAIYWYCSTTASSLGGHSFFRHRTYRCLPYPRTYSRHHRLCCEIWNRGTGNIFSLRWICVLCKYGHFLCSRAIRQCQLKSPTSF